MTAAAVLQQQNYFQSIINYIIGRVRCTPRQRCQLGRYADVRQDVPFSSHGAFMRPINAIAPLHYLLSP